jgi:hypothetical protein
VVVGHGDRARAQRHHRLRLVVQLDVRGEDLGELLAQQRDPCRPADQLDRGQLVGLDPGLQDRPQRERGDPVEVGVQHPFEVGAGEHGAWQPAGQPQLDLLVPGQQFLGTPHFPTERDELPQLHEADPPRRGHVDEPLGETGHGVAEELDDPLVEVPTAEVGDGGVLDHRDPGRLAANHRDVAGAATQVEHPEHGPEREPVRAVHADLATRGVPDPGADRLHDRADLRREVLGRGEQTTALCG